MKAKRPTRGATSGKKSHSGKGSQARGSRGRGSRGERDRLREAPPHRRTPAREARPQRSVPKNGPIRRSTDGPARPTSASQAKARSKARKAKAPKVVRTPLRQRILLRLAAVDLNPRTLVARVPFVVLIIAALGTGLGVTLWLSTDAAERSYRLGNARQVNQALIQQKEALERDVLAAQAAPALAEAARELGMIPSRDTAHLVQDAAGDWVVVGTPKPAEGVPPPPLNVELADPAPPTPPTPPTPPAPPAPRVAPLEVPVRIPPVTGRTAMTGPLPGPVQGVPPGTSAVTPGTSAVTPGLEVPHTVPGQLPAPGPSPLAVPGTPGVGVVAPADRFDAPVNAGPPLLSPEVTRPPGAPVGVEQFRPVPGAAA